MKKFKLKLNFVSILTILFFTVFPIITNNYYFDIARFRYQVFSVLAPAIFFIALYYTLCRNFEQNTGLQFRSPKEYFAFLSTTDKWMIGFLMVAIISTLLSDWKLPALTGSCGKYNGLLFLLMVGGLFYGITRYLEQTIYLKLSFPIILILTCLMAVIQFCGYDIFGFIKDISEIQNQSYISTLGNVNVFAAFISVYLPVCMYLFCSPNEKYSMIYGIGAFFGFMGILASNSDSCYLGTIIPLIILLIISVQNTKRLQRFSILVGILAMALIAWTILECIFIETMWVQSVLTKAFHSYPVIILAFCAMLVLLLFSNHLLKNDRQPAKYIFYILSGIVIFAIFSVLCIVFWFSVIDTKTDLGGLEYYLRFNKAWGKDRGTAWIWILEMFATAPILTKLFGAGPDTTALSMYTNYKYEIDNELGFYFENAHNEYMNYLGTLGIFGVICYVALIICSLRQCIQKSKQNSLFGAVGLSIVGYACMSTVNISQPITVPFIFLLISIANSNSGGTNS